MERLFKEGLWKKSLPDQKRRVIRSTAALILPYGDMGALICYVPRALLGLRISSHEAQFARINARWHEPIQQERRAHSSGMQIPGRRLTMISHIRLIVGLTVELASDWWNQKSDQPLQNRSYYFNLEGCSDRRVSGLVLRWTYAILTKEEVDITVRYKLLTPPVRINQTPILVRGPVVYLANAFTICRPVRFKARRHRHLRRYSIPQPASAS
ncbi:hypothetical protein J6590_013230 [Homalodisca vitripennis]|nr:hypothetical protein J6590_013230 [Homalodisca vitripennis]